MAKIVLLVVAFLLSTFFFKKAAGTLNPGKLNIVSFIYYVFMLQTFTGTFLVALGLDGHYTLAYLLDKETGCVNLINVITIIAILFPLSIVIIQKMLKVEVKKQYDKFLQQKVQLCHSKCCYCFLLMLSCISILLLIGLLYKIGYIPIWKLFFAGGNFDSSIERTRISTIYFLHPYITNILVLTSIPILSYISFVYALVTKEKKWYALTGILFVASIIVKTYKFEKSPMLFYLAVLLLIYIYYKGEIRLRYMVPIGIGMVGVLCLLYEVLGFNGNILDVYNGPLGRTLYTEVGTLAYHLELFPQTFGFLKGRSFTPTVLKMLGIEPELHIRSAKLVMAFYGSERVYDNTAGVMNTLFVGEAYANWGYWGVFFSVVWVAFVISCMMAIIMKLKKTPSIIAFFAFITIKMGMMLEGGFCDFVYNFEMVYVALIISIIYIIFERENRFLNMALQKISKTRGYTHRWLRKCKKK